eukprot:989628-Pleurochrysis_carterae.AAC.2
MTLAPLPPPPPSSSDGVYCGGTRAGDTTGLTNQLGNGAGDEILQFCVAQAGNFTFSTCGSQFDTVLRVFDSTQPDFTRAAEIAGCDNCGECVDTQSPGDSAVLQNVNLGIGCYTLVVTGSRGNSEGIYQLSVSCLSGRLADACPQEDTQFGSFDVCNAQAQVIPQPDSCAAGLAGEWLAAFPFDSTAAWCQATIEDLRNAFLQIDSTCDWQYRAQGLLPTDTLASAICQNSCCGSGFAAPLAPPPLPPPPAPPPSPPPTPPPTPPPP